MIHNVIPQTWVETVLGDGNPLAVVLATLVGIPMYADIFGTIPVAESLLFKGAGLGTILVLHDGGDDVELTFYDHAAESGEAQAFRRFYCSLYGGHYIGRILFQLLSAVFVVTVFTLSGRQAAET